MAKLTISVPAPPVRVSKPWTFPMVPPADAKTTVSVVPLPPVRVSIVPLTVKDVSALDNTAESVPEPPTIVSTDCTLLTEFDEPPKVKVSFPDPPISVDMVTLFEVIRSFPVPPVKVVTDPESDDTVCPPFSRPIKVALDADMLSIFEILVTVALLDTVRESVPLEPVRVVRVALALIVAALPAPANVNDEPELASTVTPEIDELIVVTVFDM